MEVIFSIFAEETCKTSVRTVITEIKLYYFLRAIVTEIQNILNFNEWGHDNNNNIFKVLGYGNVNRKMMNYSILTPSNGGRNVGT